MKTVVERQIAKFESKIRRLKARQLRNLQKRLVGARNLVGNLEAEIARLSGTLDTARNVKRKRTSPAEVKAKVDNALGAAGKRGLSQKEISEQTGLNYGTVVLFLRRNEKQFRSSGNFKSKRYFSRSSP